MAVARARSKWIFIIVLGGLGLGLGLLMPGPAAAQVKRSLSGTNLRFQIGGELEIPLAATRQENTPLGMSGTAMLNASCAPNGRINGINPIPVAQVSI